MKNCKLMYGDCLELMKKIPSKFVDLICCDLPYGTTACNWDKLIPMDLLWNEYNRIIKDNGVIVLFANGIFTPRVMASNIEDYKYRWVWIKKNSTNFVHAKNRPMTKSEDILVFSKAPMGHISQLGDRRMPYNPQGLQRVDKKIKAGKGRFGTIAGVRPSHKEEFIREYTNYPTDVLTDFPEDPLTSRIHTSQKPVALLEYLIKTYTNEGDVVLDNCMGSGSCGVACLNTGRKFIGIELKEEYFNKAKSRLISLT